MLIVFPGCKKPYNPTVQVAAKTYLVVEGVINSGSDSTIIKLSRVIPLANKTADSPVLNASVTVESANGEAYALKETGNGKYISPGLNIDKKTGTD